MNRFARLASLSLLLAAAGCGEKAAPPEVAPEPPARVVPVEPQPEMRQVVKLTPAAIKKLRAAQREADKRYLRVSVEKGGSTGFAYDMQFVDLLDPEHDFLHDADGIAVIVDKRSQLYLDGTTIDWQTTPEGKSGFQFDNPNAEK